MEYKPGATNQKADYLSRHPFMQLNELTEKTVSWVEAAKIEEAQRQALKKRFPKKVHVENDGDKICFIYCRADCAIWKESLPDDLTAEVILQLHQAKRHINLK